MIDINELRRLAQAANAAPDGEVMTWIEGMQRLQGALLPDDVLELLDRLEVAEKERDALRAEIAAMKRQEPVAWLHETRRDSDVVTSAVKHVWGKAVTGSLAAYSIPLYALPGAQAQPAPSLASGDASLINEGKTQPAPSHALDDIATTFLPIPCGHNTRATDAACDGCVNRGEK